MLDVSTRLITICLLQPALRRNGCSALVRMPTKGSHTTKNYTDSSQERNNFSVDMEEESSDMDNVNDRNTLYTEQVEEQPTSTG